MPANQPAGNVHLHNSAFMNRGDWHGKCRFSSLPFGSGVVSNYKSPSLKENDYINYAALHFLLQMAVGRGTYRLIKVTTTGLRPYASVQNLKI